MIDPTNITNFKASTYELQEMALFWICAAGKNGVVSARLLDNLLKKINPENKLPFSILKEYVPDVLAPIMKEVGIGCQTSKSRSMIELSGAKLDLRTCSTEDLETIHGIGMKTSRCFLMHSRANLEVAALDTHVLKYLRSLGYDAPKSTPTRKKYLELEKIFLKLAKEQGKSIAGMDLEIWNSYAVK
jgi:endonuclease III